MLLILCTPSFAILVVYVNSGCIRFHSHLTLGHHSLIDPVFVSSPSHLHACSIKPPLTNSDHYGRLVSFPDPFRKNREGVWQHVLHCGVQKEFNQLLNHVLMFTHASGNWMSCMQYLCVGHWIMEQCRFCS